MKKFCFWIMMIVLVFVSLFTIGEICFRVFREPPNPLFDVTQQQKDFLFKPNDVKHSTSSVEGEFAYTAHINRFGYRGKDFTLEKTPGRLRIFVVGDSFTYGVGAEDNETIPYLIEKYLQAQGINAEVINAGVGHASPVSHYFNIRDIHLKYKPDLVLLLFDLTDLWDDWHTERSAVYDKAGNVVDFNPLYVNGHRSWWLTLVNHSAFARWIHDKIVRGCEKMVHLGFKEYMRIAKEKKRAKAAIANSDTIPPEVVMYYDGLIMMRGQKRKALIDQHWHERTAKYLTKIRDLLRENNIPMVLVMYPQGIYVGGDQWAEGRETWGFERGKKYTDYYPFDLGESYAKSENIPFINTLNDFLQAPPEVKYFYDWDGHMTPAGYKIVAESISASKIFKDEINMLVNNK